MGDIILRNDENAKVLILAGDVCEIANLQPYDEESIDYRSQRLHHFFIRCGKEFEYVLWVMGNHEFYHGSIDDTVDIVRKYLDYIPNLTILDNETMEIDGIVFVGGTLWSNMNDTCYSTIHHVKYSMNDYRIIHKDTNIKAYDSQMNVVDLSLIHI